MPDTTNCVIPNLAIEGIFTFLFTAEPSSLRWGSIGSKAGHIEIPTTHKLLSSQDVRNFCRLRSLNLLFWERSYNFIQKATDAERFYFYGDLPPLFILRTARVVNLYMLCKEGYCGRMDLSNNFTLRYLELSNIYDSKFSLTPPPNLEKLKVTNSDIDLESLIQGLKETRIKSFEINCPGIKNQPAADISSLNELTKLIWHRVKLPMAWPPKLEFLVLSGNKNSLHVENFSRAKTVERIELWQWPMADDTIDLKKFNKLKSLKIFNCRLKFRVSAILEKYFQLLSKSDDGEDFHGDWLLEATGLRKLLIDGFNIVDNWKLFLTLHQCEDLEFVSYTDDTWEHLYN